MANKIILLLLLIVIITSRYAVADCEYNGEVYPEGTVIGPYTCRGGQWEIK